MEGSDRAALAAASRCLVALPGRRGAAPDVVPAPAWFDGEALWVAAPAGDGLAATLDRQPGCAVVLPAAADRGAVVAVGNARVYSPADPLGLVLHAPTVLAAGAALALRHAGRLPAWLRHAAAAPEKLLPRDRVVARVALGRVRTVTSPTPPPGVAPALPTVVPPEVRRGLAGARDVVLLTAGAGGLVVTPAAWSAGFGLTLAGGARLPAGVDVTAAVEVPTPDGPGPVAGLALAGTVGPGPSLHPRRARWWTDGVRGEAQVPPARTGALVLPD